MTIASWNIFGIRSHEEAFCHAFDTLRPDIFCLQEVKTSEDRCNIMFDGYRRYWNPGIRHNDNGVAVYTRFAPLSVSYDTCPIANKSDGRIIILEHERFYLLCTYVPYSNSTEGLKYRTIWNGYYQQLIHELQGSKPIICCGDHNIVRSPIDCWDGKPVRSQGCFYPSEHKDFENLLTEEHLTDVFRHLHPNDSGFSFWPFNPKSARDADQGFRIDYFLASEELLPLISECQPQQTIKGSCNCPILLYINTN